MLPKQPVHATNNLQSERRQLLAMAGFALGFSALPSASALAQLPPVKGSGTPLRWLVPFPPGGGTDLATRIVAKRLGEKLGRAVIVDNKPGAATAIAALEVARSRPDGNTLLTAGMSTLALNPSLYPRLQYRAERDFALVSGLARLPMVLVVNPALPVRDLKELVAWLRVQGDKASYASTGAGVPHHVTMALWLDGLKLETQHVPYKSMPGALQDLAGGQFALMFGDLAAAVPLIKAGRLRALAQPSRTRSQLLPDVPTFAEAGMPYEAAAWQGIVLPAGTPPETVALYSTTLKAILQEPDVVEQFSHHGMEPMASGAEDFARFVAAERERWAAVIRSKKISIE
jgi:tripartite-type tricarboxylate transporter receptor subunit TctC